jgi:hypothetical protein
MIPSAVRGCDRVVETRSKAGRPVEFSVSGLQDLLLIAPCRFGVLGGFPVPIEELRTYSKEKP